MCYAGRKGLQERERGKEGKRKAGGRSAFGVLESNNHLDSERVSDGGRGERGGRGRERERSVLAFSFLFSIFLFFFFFFSFFILLREGGCVPVCLR